MSEWFTNLNNLVELARYLLEIHPDMSKFVLLGIFEKPWHYENEWNQLQEIRSKNE